MHLNKGEFIIARVGEKRKALLKCTTSGDPAEKTIKAVVANEFCETDEAEKFEVDRPDILATLGEDPEEGGSAYGVKIEPWRENFVIKGWGEIRSFRTMNSKDKTALVKSLSRCGKRLRKRKMNGFIPFCNIYIYPKKGSHAGSYHYKPDDMDRLALHPKDLAGSETPLTALIYHECGHGYYFRIMNAQWRARWVRLYHRCVKLSSIDISKVKEIGKEFISSRMSIKEFGKGLEETRSALFYECIDWVTVNHHLSYREIDMLIEAGEDINDLWPDRALLMSDVEALVSDYGSKNTDEFFAEAFMFYMTKQDLPAGITKLMKKTLKAFGSV